ncbi:RNA methyltransferase substrate-binding domain-containing protein, partial [Ectothiorhodospira haloalkaliphila]
MAAHDEVFGLHAVEALLRQSPGRVESLRVQSGRVDARMQAILDQADRAGIPVTR